MHYPRWQQSTINQMMVERRVLWLGGASQCGKTTLARRLEYDLTEYRTLDDATLREVAENDPKGFIKRHTTTPELAVVGSMLCFGTGLDGLQIS